MSVKQSLSISSLAFLVGGLYFIAVALLGQASNYSIAIGILCLISFALPFAKIQIISGPWRLASAISALVVFLGQEIISSRGSNALDSFSIITILINGALFVLFLGIVLASLQGVVKLTPLEDEEETVSA